MIKIKSYRKRELARMYWPESPNDRMAVERLRRDIRRCKGLTEALRLLPGHKSRTDRFTALEVKTIVEFYGEPYYDEDDVR